MTPKLGLGLTDLPILQQYAEEGFFALSTDDGANILDDDNGLMETYGGSPS